MERVNKITDIRDGIVLGILMSLKKGRNGDRFDHGLYIIQKLFNIKAYLFPSFLTNSRALRI